MWTWREIPSQFGRQEGLRHLHNHTDYYVIRYLHNHIAVQFVCEHQNCEGVWASSYIAIGQNMSRWCQRFLIWHKTFYSLIKWQWLNVCNWKDPVYFLFCLALTQYKLLTCELWHSMCLHKKFLQKTLSQSQLTLFAIFARSIPWHQWLMLRTLSSRRVCWRPPHSEIFLAHGHCKKCCKIKKISLNKCKYKCVSDSWNEQHE